MSLFALVSAKHSPGTTTSALALAVAWSLEEPALVAELDPAGGDLAARLDLTTEPGLTSLAGAARRSDQPVELGEHCQSLGTALTALVGPTSPAQASASLRWLEDRLAPGLSAFEGAVFADCGRWDLASPANGLLNVADLVLFVMRPTLEGAEHVRSRLDQTTGVGRVAVLLVGDRPYRPTEVMDALDVDVAGVLEHEPRGAEALVRRRDVRTGSRTPLMRSARSVVDGLDAYLASRMDARS